MINFFLLNGKDVSGKERLKIFEHGYLNAELTDYVISKKAPFNEKNRKCYNWWLNSDSGALFGAIYSITNGRMMLVNLNLDGYGVRPAVQFNDIKPFVTRCNDINEDVMEVEFGTYPQSFVPDEVQTYIDKLKLFGFLEEVSPGIFKREDTYFTKNNDSSWIIYEPVIWVVDKNSGIAVTKKIIDGVSFDYRKTQQFLEGEFPYKLLSQVDIISSIMEKCRLLEEQKEEIENELGQLREDIMVLGRTNHNYQSNN